MGVNIFNLRQPSPSIYGRRNNAGEIGPTLADGSFYSTSSSSNSSFSWNNLISTLGNTISSVFGGLTSAKQLEAMQNAQMYQQRNNNSMLWVGIGVVAVIVIAIILLSRKK